RLASPDRCHRRRQEGAARIRHGSAGGRRRRDGGTAQTRHRPLGTVRQVREDRPDMTAARVHPLDHFMLAAPNLEAATADFERRAGVKPSEGGRHPGQGSRNVLAALGERCYLEIIGPDLTQGRANNFGDVLSRLASPVLLKFAVQTSDIDATHKRAVELGLWPLTSSGARATGPFAMSRALPGGGLLTWRLLLLGSDRYEGCVPCFI